MKKEIFVGKILLKSLIGFTLGVTLLMVAYMSMYFIEGEELFVKEIKQLQNVETFIYQIISVGVVGFISLIVFNFFVIQNKEVKEENNKNERLNTILFLILLPTSMILTFILSTNTKIFSDNISISNVVLWVITYIITMLIFTIIFLTEFFQVNFINKKLKSKI